MTDPRPDDLVTLEEAGKRLGISRITLWRRRILLLQDGRLLSELARVGWDRPPAGPRARTVSDACGRFPAPI